MTESLPIKMLYDTTSKEYPVDHLKFADAPNTWSVQQFTLMKLTLYCPKNPSEEIALYLKDKLAEPIDSETLDEMPKILVGVNSMTFPSGNCGTHQTQRNLP